MRVVELPCLSEGEAIICHDVIFVAPGSGESSACAFASELQRLAAAIRAKSQANQTTSSQP